MAQISMEAALAACEKRLGALIYENVLLSAQLAEQAAENERRQSAPTMRPYPYSDGDVMVLGPETIASSDGEVISWKGENYSRQQVPAGSGLQQENAAYNS
jgi:hypothetical protein